MFEYDPDKSAANLAKHGIDFERAKELWLDEDAVEVPGDSVAELRVMRIGFLAGKCWTAVYTIRHGEVRIISARRARLKEVRRYEQEDHQR